ncbi:hypothetical protein [Nocardia uniformis]|nr:hypothetical protein [Nocardia uniformis]
MKFDSAAVDLTPHRIQVNVRLTESERWHDLTALLAELAGIHTIH